MHFTENCFAGYLAELRFCLLCSLRWNRSSQSSLEPRHAASFTNEMRQYEIHYGYQVEKTVRSGGTETKQRVLIRVSSFEGVLRLFYIFFSWKIKINILSNCYSFIRRIVWKFIYCDSRCLVISVKGENWIEDWKLQRNYVPWHWKRVNNYY